MRIGHQVCTFTFQQDGSKLTGTANSEAGERKREAGLLDGEVEGDTMSLAEILRFQDREIRISYRGTLAMNRSPSPRPSPQPSTAQR